MSEPIKLTVSTILQDLKDGYTRTKDDKQYSGDGKSIQEKYNLKKSDVTRLFQHDKLKGRKTISEKAVTFILEDDTETGSTAQVETEAPEEPVKKAVAKKLKLKDIPADIQETDTGMKESEEDPLWLNTESTNQ
jgi:hypothetical protein